MSQAWEDLGPQWPKGRFDDQISSADDIAAGNDPDAMRLFRNLMNRSQAGRNAVYAVLCSPRTSLERRRQIREEIYGPRYKRHRPDFGRCIYCGDAEQVLDHVPAISRCKPTLEDARKPHLLVPSCWRCNALLSSTAESCLNRRREILGFNPSGCCWTCQLSEGAPESQHSRCKETLTKGEVQ